MASTMIFLPVLVVLKKPAVIALRGTVSSRCELCATSWTRTLFSPWTVASARIQTAPSGVVLAPLRSQAQGAGDFVARASS